jgi:radical SAM superfamily enzyme YgiQ (UPF0313 family)
MLFFYRRGDTFRRSLGGEVHLRFREGRGRGVRQRRQLERWEARELVAEVYDLARGVLEADPSGRLVRRLEEEILPWDAEALAAEGERFAAVYKPVSILPPDQYLSVVLQATEGCSWNQCTFCSFYMDRPFAVKDPAAFAEHVDSVKSFLGRGLELRRGVFLADGNALALGDGRLLPLLEVVRRKLPGRAIYSFIDLYTGERRSEEAWRRLADSGLDRVYVGMETGDDELLARVNKPGTREELEEFVSVLKRAGLRVSLIVMVGLGGIGYREAHRAATLEAIRSMPLGEGDLVYLSPFVETEGSRYASQRVEHGLEPMTETDIERELQAMATVIRSEGVQASRYDIREFVY